MKPYLASAILLNSGISPIIGISVEKKSFLVNWPYWQNF